MKMGLVAYGESFRYRGIGLDPVGSNTVGHIITAQGIACSMQLPRTKPNTESDNKSLNAA